MTQILNKREVRAHGKVSAPSVLPTLPESSILSREAQFLPCSAMCLRTHMPPTHMCTHAHQSKHARAHARTHG